MTMRRGLWCLMAGLCMVVPAIGEAEEPVFPASGVKAPYSPLAVPTRLAPLSESLETLLNRQYRIVAAHTASGEEIVILERAGKGIMAGSTVLCALTLPDPAKDQNVMTSRCWALNRPGRG